MLQGTKQGYSQDVYHPLYLILSSFPSLLSVTYQTLSLPFSKLQSHTQWREQSRQLGNQPVVKRPESNVSYPSLKPLPGEYQLMYYSGYQGRTKDTCRWWCQEAPQVQARYRRLERNQAIPEVSTFLALYTSLI